MDLDELRAIAPRSLAENLEDSRRMAALSHLLVSEAHHRRREWAAIAGGCGIATLADFTLAVPEAKFGYTEVKIGFMPAVVSVFLRRQIGEKRARDLLLSGRIIDAADALRWACHRNRSRRKAAGARAEIAGILLAASPTSIARTKRLLLDSMKPH